MEMDYEWFDERGLSWADIEMAYLYNALIDSRDHEVNHWRNKYEHEFEARETVEMEVRDLRRQIANLNEIISEVEEANTHQAELIAHDRESIRAKGHMISALQADKRMLYYERNVARTIADHFHTVFCRDDHSIDWEMTTEDDTIYSDGMVRLTMMQEETNHGE